MVFASTSFIFLFLPLFLLAYAAVGKQWRNLTILVFSWLFYAWWRLDFLPLIVSIGLWSWVTGGWGSFDSRALYDGSRPQYSCGFQRCSP